MGYDDKDLRFMRSTYEDYIDRLVEMYTGVRADERRVAKSPAIIVLGTRNDAGARFKAALMRQRRRTR